MSKIIRCKQCNFRCDDYAYMAEHVASMHNLATPQDNADGSNTPRGSLCCARTVFWPDDEACDAECILPKGHVPTDMHQDEILGEWSEDELNTYGGEES